MAEILNPHGLKTTPTTKFGTRELACLVIQRNDENSWVNETDPDSDYSRAVRALQTRAEIYAVFTANESSYFTAFVAADTLVQDEGDEANDGTSDLDYLGTEMSDILGFNVRVWNGKVRSDDIAWDC